MKKVRRILSVLLVLNFLTGMKNGMQAVNLVLVIGNGMLVILAAVIEIKKNGR